MATYRESPRRSHVNIAKTKSTRRQLSLAFSFMALLLAMSVPIETKPASPNPSSAATVNAVVKNSRPDAKPSSRRTTPVRNASFDCTRNDLNATEQMICSNERASNLDIQLSYAYSLVLDMSDENARSEIKADEKQWIVGVRNKCHDMDCLLKAYRERIDSLHSQAQKNLSNNVPLLQTIYPNSPDEVNQKRVALQDCVKGAVTLLFCTMAMLDAENHVMEGLVREKRINIPHCGERLGRSQIEWKKTTQTNCEKARDQHGFAGVIGTAASADLNSCLLEATARRVSRIKTVRTCSDISVLDTVKTR